MSTDDNEQKAARPRKVQRSISTADRAGFQTAEPRPEGEVVKWDMRAERPAPAPGEAPPPSARPRRRPPTGEFRPRRDDDAPRRPGASGGRAMPEMPQRGPVDRSSAEFVDRWLSQKPRPPQGPREGGGRPEGRGEGRPDRRPRRDGQGPRAEARPASAPRVEAPRREEPSKKLPSLHETILVGLPRVSEEGRAAAQQNKPKTAREAIAAKAAATQKAQPAEPRQDKAPARAVDPAWTTATADTAVASLRAAQDLADKVVDAWLAQNNVAAIAEAGQSEALSGPARKASRRALSVLKARGVAIPAPAAKAARQSPAAAGEIVEATFTSPDSRGTSSYTIAVRQGTDRAHIAEVIVRDEVGVIQAVSGWMSRSQIKEAHQRVAEGSGLTPVAVPADWVRHRVAEAKKKNQTSQVLVPLSIEKCKEIIEPVPEAAPAHPIADLENGLDESAAAGSASLHGEPEFRAWLPESQALDELVRKVGQALTQEEAQDPKKVDEVLKAEIKSATDRFFTPEVRERLAERMRDAAISVRARAGDDRAKDVLRVARAIKSAGLITSPPHEIEFLESFFQKGVAVMAQRGGGSVRVPTRG